jgi:hypothetical protein
MLLMRSLAPIAIAVGLVCFGATACSSKPAEQQASSTTAAAPSLSSPPASSKPTAPGSPLNGTYTATTDNGKRTVNGLPTPTPNDVSTWTITSECTGADTCSGQVTSDQGWNAPAEFAHGRWTVKFDKADAVQCPNGPSVSATVAYSFDVRTLTGIATTVNAMGSCGPGQIVSQAPWALVKKP